MLSRWNVACRRLRGGLPTGVLNILRITDFPRRIADVVTACAGEALRIVTIVSQRAGLPRPTRYMIATRYCRQQHTTRGRLLAGWSVVHRRLRHTERNRQPPKNSYWRQTHTSRVAIEPQQVVAGSGQVTTIPQLAGRATHVGSCFACQPQRFITLKPRNAWLSFQTRFIVTPMDCCVVGERKRATEFMHM